MSVVSETNIPGAAVGHRFAARPHAIVRVSVRTESRMQPNPPNLFDFAPSELSQDAFLSWTLAHADPERGKERPEIQALGSAFLAAMFDKDESAPPPAEVQSVKVKRQVEGIDILCVVNGSIAIVLEDKVGTTEHSGQLDAYRKVVEQEGYGDAGKRIVLIYLQTGNQGTYRRVRKAGYNVFSRLDLLSLLEGPAGKAAIERSDIVMDFARRLRRIETEVQSFRTKPHERWSANARMGFYMALQETFPSANWRKVANPAGGLYAFFWGGAKVEGDCKPYLQIESAGERLALCFKIDADKGDQKALQRKWHRAVLAGATALDIRAARPSKFQPGKTMTVAVFSEFPVKDSDGIVDIAKTVELMTKAEALLRACVLEATARGMPTAEGVPAMLETQ